MSGFLNYFFGFWLGFGTVVFIVWHDPSVVPRGSDTDCHETIAALEANARKYDDAVKHLESLLEESWATQDKLADAATKEVQQAYRDADELSGPELDELVAKVAELLEAEEADKGAGQ